jgi:hypothetical protein
VVETLLCKWEALSKPHFHGKKKKKGELTYHPAKVDLSLKEKDL